MTEHDTEREAVPVGRVGYRRLHLLLKKDGLAMNQNRLRRLFEFVRLQVRKRDGRW